LIGVVDFFMCTLYRHSSSLNACLLAEGKILVLCFFDDFESPLVTQSTFAHMLTCILVSVGILGCTFWSVYTNELFCRFSCHGQKLAIGPGNVCTSVAHANEYSILHQQQNIPSRNKSWMEGIWNLAYLWDPELFLISVFFVRPINIIPVFQWIKKNPAIYISFHFLLFGSRIFSHTFQIIYSF